MLEKIAGEMRAYALAHPRLRAEGIEIYQRKLSGGLVVMLFLDGRQVWHLSLAREGKAPSATEVKTVRRDFNVPAEANQEISLTGQWQIVRLTWKEATQKPLFEVAPVDKSTYYKD